MVFLRIIILSFLFIINANAETVRIAIDKNDPPFVYSAAGNTYYGFDVDMLNFICTNLQLECQYIPTTFENLLPLVREGKADIAASSIFITPERAQYVNFSIPYLMSYMQFLGKKGVEKQSFDLTLLNNKKFGYERGTLIPMVIKSLGIQNPTLVPFDNNNDVVFGIMNGTVDFGLFTENAALYWVTNSSDKIVKVGQLIPFGLGVGIAVNKRKIELLNNINKALVIFQNGNAFKTNYNKYLAHF